LRIGEVSHGVEAIDVLHPPFAVVPSHLTTQLLPGFLTPCVAAMTVMTCGNDIEREDATLALCGLHRDRPQRTAGRADFI
jgi:hypothetical protein